MILRNHLDVRGLCFLVGIALQLFIARKIDVEQIPTMKIVYQPNLLLPSPSAATASNLSS